MKVIQKYVGNTPVYTIGDDNVIREYVGNTPVYTINGNVIQKYVGNTPIYTINGNIIQEYVGNTPVYTINGNIIQKYVGNTPVYIIQDDSGNPIEQPIAPNGGKQQSGGALALLGKILGFLFIHPIGNIVLGFLWLMHCIFNMAGGFHGLGFYMREGGWLTILIGLIAIVVGIFRTIRRYRK